MPNATVRANARALPKTTKHPDAAIFELAERCTAAWQRREAACDLLEEADQRHRAMEPPKALVKTAQDDEMGLFVGNGVGEMALPSHIVAWLSLEARQLRPRSPPMRGVFLGGRGGNAELRLPRGPPFLLRGL
jgi:hypothetical protein